MMDKELDEEETGRTGVGGVQKLHSWVRITSPTAEISSPP